MQFLHIFKCIGAESLSYIYGNTCIAWGPAAAALFQTFHFVNLKKQKRMRPSAQPQCIREILDMFQQILFFIPDITDRYYMIKDTGCNFSIFLNALELKFYHIYGNTCIAWGHCVATRVPNTRVGALRAAWCVAGRLRIPQFMEIPKLPPNHPRHG